MRIGRYLLGSKTKGMIYSPDLSKGLEVYVDADFVGGWDTESFFRCGHALFLY